MVHSFSLVLLAVTCIGGLHCHTASLTWRWVVTPPSTRVSRGPHSPILTRGLAPMLVVVWEGVLALLVAILSAPGHESRSSHSRTLFFLRINNILLFTSFRAAYGGGGRNSSATSRTQLAVTSIETSRKCPSLPFGTHTAALLLPQLLPC